MVDLSEAAKRVEVLEKFPFEDDQPHVEGPLLSVLYNSATGLEFNDRAAFDSRWTEELASISQLVCLLNWKCNGWPMYVERGNQDGWYICEYAIYISKYIESTKGEFF